MSLQTDYATKLRQVADTFATLDVDRRDPHRYHERKDEAVQNLREIANAVELDQVFSGRTSLPASAHGEFRRGPRTILVKGRPVQVETKRRAFARG